MAIGPAARPPLLPPHLGLPYRAARPLHDTRDHPPPADAPAPACCTNSERTRAHRSSKRKGHCPYAQRQRKGRGHTLSRAPLGGEGARKGALGAPQATPATVLLPQQRSRKRSSATPLWPPRARTPPPKGPSPGSAVVFTSALNSPVPAPAPQHCLPSLRSWPMALSEPRRPSRATPRCSSRWNFSRSRRPRDSSCPSSPLHV